MEKQNVVIIGSGPAGLTAAIYLSRANLKPLVIEGPNPGGQLMETTDIENFPGFPDGISGAVLMAQMKTQAKKFGTEFLADWVESVDFSDGENLKIKTTKHEIFAKSLIVATGASARWLNLGKGEEKYKGKGYTACATCDGAFFREKTVAVVGGGDTACEEAVFLTKFAKKVYMLVRGDKMRASQIMQDRAIGNEKIEVLWKKQVSDLKGETVLEAVDLQDSVSKEISELKLGGLFMAIGRVPSSVPFGDSLEKDELGYLKVSDNIKTKYKNIFVAGDVADRNYQQAVTAAGFGCMAALHTEHLLSS